MEIDEVITCCIEIAEENERISNVIENEGENWTDSGKTYYDICKKRASEHRQFAEWLKELKERREIMDFIDSNVRVIETNDKTLIRFGGGNVCDWAKRKGERYVYKEK